MTAPARRLRIGIWSPLPPATSGVADYVAESLPALSERLDLHVVVEDPAAVDADLRQRFDVRAASPRLGSSSGGASGPPLGPAPDLAVYHLGNSPDHAFVYRRALRHPGVVVLHEWSLHHLVLHETVERGDLASYLREMRRAHGERGTFVARQVARALGGDLLPALFPLSDRVLERSLAVVALTAAVTARVARRLPARPRLHLRHHLALPLDPLPSRAEARGALGLPADALLVTAPGLATATKGLRPAMRALGRLRRDFPALHLVVAGERDPRLPLAEWAAEAGLGAAWTLTGRVELSDFVRHLCAADLVLGLRFPSHGEMSGALVRALGVGRPVLVTAGTPAADEFPEGVVVPVAPGPHEEDELFAVLGHLLRSPDLRETIGGLARAHVREHHGLPAVTRELVGFLEDVHLRKAALAAAVAAEEGDSDASLLAYFTEEVRAGARDLGLLALPLGLDAILGSLGGAAAGRAMARHKQHPPAE
jgi:glycosyltransferase involved in cell wall biosynthesis